MLWLPVRVASQNNMTNFVQAQVLFLNKELLPFPVRAPCSPHFTFSLIMQTEAIMPLTQHYGADRCNKR